MHLKKFGMVALALCALASAAKAQFVSTYSFSLDEEVTLQSMIVMESGESSGSLTLPFSTSGPGSTTWINEGSSPNHNISFVLGIATFASEIEDPQKHAVLFMNDDAAAFADANVWSTLFQDIEEESLIASIEAATNGQSQEEVNGGLEVVSAFGEYAKTFPATHNSTKNAWFTLGGGYKVVSFSTGRIIGSGISTKPSAPVPEPASMLVFGLGGMALLRRRTVRK